MTAIILTLAAMCYLANGFVFAFLASRPGKSRIRSAVVWTMFWPVVILLTVIGKIRP